MGTPSTSLQKLYSSQSIKDIETIHIYLAEKRKIQVGDKMSGRHGNKGIVSQILPIQDMPFLPDGTPIDMVLNPLGVPSRMNVGQIYECLLGLAGKYLGEHYKIFSFDEIYGPEASRSFVFNKLYEARCKTGFKWLFNPEYPGKIRLFDGRTGDCYHQPVTVGQAYMLRLVHMVDDKIHMRSTGPYSLVTQQPLRGRSKQGGQRLGEMEVWALEGYGAAFTLLEMLTVKSDDLTGRMTLWSNLILNKDLTIGTPEAFKVLICELQALCLDIGLFRYNTTNPNTYPLGEEILKKPQGQEMKNYGENRIVSSERREDETPSAGTGGSREGSARTDLTSQSKFIKGPYQTKSLTEMTSLMSFP
jgi:DNA-directed RNA polymerase subunit beta